MKKTLFVLAFLFFATSDVFACTTAIVTAGASETGRPILWKQRDNRYENCVIYNDEGHFAFVGIANLPVANEKHLAAGVNEVGFAIVRNTCNSMLHSPVEPSRTMGILHMALTECETVDDFQKLLDSIPKPRPFGSNFGVIDAKGGAAYFEAGDYSYNRYDVPDGEYMIRTNFALQPVVPINNENNMSVHRFNQAQEIMGRHKGKFSSEWLMDNLARSFYSTYNGADMLEAAPGGRAFDRDFICRRTSISDVSIEGIGPGDRANSSVMWTMCGYPACCYAIPVWVAAGQDLPKCLSDDGTLSCEVFKFARECRDYVHSEYYEYVDFNRLKPILKEARKAERAEFAEGRRVENALRRGFNRSLVRKYNSEADSRWKLWSKRIREKYLPSDQGV